MKYVDINLLQLEEKNGLDIMDLIGVHDLMNDSKDSVAEEIMQRFEKGETLPPMAFSIVFEHLDYFQKIHEDIAVLQKLMNAEKENKLPKLKAHAPNAEILANYYINAMDNYIDEAYEVKDWIDNNSLEEKFAFLSDFCIANNLDSEEEKETLYEIISDWRMIAGDKIADYILTKKETDKLSQDETNSLVDIALKYNPNCVEALKLKVDYLKMKRVK